MKLLLLFFVVVSFACSVHSLVPVGPREHPAPTTEAFAPLGKFLKATYALVKNLESVTGTCSSKPAHCCASVTQLNVAITKYSKAGNVLLKELKGVTTLLVLKTIVGEVKKQVKNQVEPAVWNSMKEATKQKIPCLTEVTALLSNGFAQFLKIVYGL